MQACDLCGLTTRHGAVTDEIAGRSLVFCCTGCRQVYRMLMEASDSPDPAHFRETEIYRRCVDAGIIPQSEADLEKRAGSQPSGNQQDGQGAADPGDSESAPPPERCLPLDLTVYGMWCPACAWVIEESLQRMPGVQQAACHFVTDRVRLFYDPVKSAPHRIMAAVDRLGYQAVPAGAGRGRESVRAYVRLGISAFLTMNVMMLSFALYSGFFMDLPGESAARISWPILVMAVVVFVYGGAPIHRKALSGIRMGAPGMEALITLGAGSAFAYSLYNFSQGSIHLYFDTAAMLITLVLIGKAVEQRTRDRVQARISSFFDLLPQKVRVCSRQYPEGRFAGMDALGTGDIFRVLADETIPADGRIVSGTGRVNESALTGEARPVAKKTGDTVSSGTRLISGDLQAKTTARGPDSMAGQLISIMEDALAKKTGIEDAADRVLRFFVPAVVLLALGTGAVWFASGLEFRQALIRGVTVLVISCPCALGVAIPLARVAGISLAGEKGILVHDFTAFERIRHVNATVFDKTGTLTQGNWTLVEILPVAEEDTDRLLCLAAGLEKNSAHRAAEAIVQAAAARGIAPAAVCDAAAEENGICGNFGQERVRIGSAAFMAAEIAAFRQELERLQLTERPDLSYVYMSVSGRLAAVFCFGDPLRASGARLIRDLQQRGVKLALVSGDSEQTTRAVGQALGIADCRGELLPKDKAEFVDALKKQGYYTAMVGDGINDAPALAAADLGIAVHNGTNIGTKASAVTLMGNDPDRIRDFEHLAGHVARTVRQNLWFTFFYNAVAIPVAMSGLLNPLVAVGAMMLSSLSVTGNTLLLSRRQGGKKT